MSEKSLLVPTDFTTVARVAMEHAAKLAETTGSKVVLLHVVSKAGEVESAKEKLAEEAKLITESNSGVQVDCRVRIGSIFEDIGDTAAEESAELIIMGTHGAKGWQKIAGSHALKVITNSDVPFIVVQSKGVKHSGYDEIVVPMDLSDETKQKLELVADMAGYFKSKVHVIVPNATDAHLMLKVKSNIQFTHKFLSERGIAHDTKIADKSGSFDEQVLEYAADVDADLLAVMNLSGSQFMGGRHEQAMITNENEIPVMMVNPTQANITGTVFSR